MEYMFSSFENDFWLLSNSLFPCSDSRTYSGVTNYIHPLLIARGACCASDERCSLLLLVVSVTGPSSSNFLVRAVFCLSLVASTSYASGMPLLGVTSDDSSNDSDRKLPPPPSVR